MTKRERKIVKVAIDDIMAEDGDFSGAIGRLCRLVGWRYPLSEIKMTSTTLAALAGQGPTMFTADKGK